MAYLYVSTDADTDLSALQEMAEAYINFTSAYAQAGTGDQDEESVINTENLAKVKSYLPFDIGLIYCDYYYDDQISYDISDMVGEIWDEYKKVFENNTWMSEETKQNAIKNGVLKYCERFKRQSQYKSPSVQRK